MDIDGSAITIGLIITGLFTIAGVALLGVVWWHMMLFLFAFNFSKSVIRERLEN